MRRIEWACKWDIGQQKIAVIYLGDLGSMQEGGKHRDECGHTSALSSAALATTHVHTY